MSPFAFQCLMLAMLVTGATALYFWTAREGRKLDEDLHRPHTDE